MPHGKCRKGKEPRKQPGHTFKPLKHQHAKEHQAELADALCNAGTETTCIDGKNAAHRPAHHPVHDAIENA